MPPAAEPEILPGAKQSFSTTLGDASDLGAFFLLCGFHLWFLLALTPVTISAAVWSVQSSHTLSSPSPWARGFVSQ